MAAFTRSVPSSGMNDTISPVLPLEMKLRSAGMIGSLRSRYLNRLAIENTTMTVPKMAVATQKRFRNVTTTRYIRPTTRKFSRNCHWF